MVLYFIILKIWLYATEISLSSYQGADSVFSFSVGDRLKRVLECYRDIKRNLVRNELGLVGNRAIRIVFAFCLIFSFAVFLYLGIRIKGIVIKILYYGVVLALPIGINLIYPMTSEHTFIYPLMRYSVVFVWILPFYALELLKQDKGRRAFPILDGLVRMCVVIAAVNYVYSANIAYTKISFLQEQTTSYYTVMITQIKSCEGYRDEMPVAFIGAGRAEDLTFTVNDKYRVYLPVITEDLKQWVNEYSYLEYLRNHCGFSPRLASEEAVMGICDEIEKMPVYPDYGSIQVVNDIVVVKLAEMELNN